MRTLVITTILATLALFGAAWVLAEDSPATQPSAQESQMPMGCKGMMAGTMPSTAEPLARDNKLDELLATVRSTKGDEKIEAMAAVIDTLVAEHKTMGSGCGMMKMQGCAMAKMQISTGCCCKGGSCPMMKPS